METKRPLNQMTRRRLLKQIALAGGAAALHPGLLAAGVPALQAPIRQLKLPRIDTSQEVAILGAGVAGLTAAYRLLNSGNGYRCTILEANPIVGGRSLTLRPNDVLREEGQPEQVCTFEKETDEPYEPYLNAGPGRIPSAHVNLLAYCEELNVPLEVYIMESRSNLVTPPRIDGHSAVNRQVVNDTRGWIAHHLYQLAGSTGLDDDQQGLLRSLLIRFGQLGSDGSYVDTNGKYAASGPPRSGYEELPGIQDGKPVQPLSLEELLDSEFWSETSLYQPEDFLWQPTMFQPVGGMDMIVKAFEAWIDNHPEGQIIKQAEVTNIDKQGDKFSISYRKDNEIETLPADRCLSNIPIPLLENRLNLEIFSQDFQESLQAVFDSDFLAPTCKVGWQAARQLWQQPSAERVVPIYGGISWTNHALTQIWYPSDQIYARLGVLTGAYNFGQDAIDWGQLEPDQRLALARVGAAELGGNAFAGGLGHGITIAWQNMPFQKGGWAQWQNVEQNENEHYNRLLQGDNDFYIIGDQMSVLPGWQEGAVVSAVHATQQMADETYEAPPVLVAPNSKLLVEGF